MESSSMAQHEHANTAKWASKTLSPFDLGAKTVGFLGSSHFFEAGLGKAYQHDHADRFLQAQWGS